MAAYASLVSLKQIIHQLEDHPSPPISIHKQQLEDLTENVTFLQEFLDSYDSPFAYNNKADPLAIRIANAAYAAEDVIETEIVTKIEWTRFMNQTYGQNRMVWVVIRLKLLFWDLCKGSATEEEVDDLYEGLHQVIEDMNLIKKEVMENTVVQPQVQVQVQGEVSSTQHVDSSSRMVGFDEVFLEALDKLTRGQPNRQIIPITGMPGIGKTTLAQNLFKSAHVREHFDIHIWITISQVYDTLQTLREALTNAGVNWSYGSDEKDLGVMLHKHLYSKRYLVVMDDIWSVEAWDKMKFFFPEYNNGSRIMVTTRMSDLSSRLSESNNGIQMKFLDEVGSWGLFCKIVFGEESIPPQFENIGREIVANCKGLPLSIATIGGMLAKSQRTEKLWYHVLYNLSSVVIANNNKSCLKILKMSYVHLPNYLKPCFLYMGVYREDQRIRVSTLKNLWVCEGILKPVSGKSLEATAEEYFKNLVDRNLILVDELGFSGNVKFCKMHDMLRELCLRQAAIEEFYRIGWTVYNIPRSINVKRRVVIYRDVGYSDMSTVIACSSNIRSILSEKCTLGKEMYPELLEEHYAHVRLLRILKAYDKDLMGRGRYGLDVVFQQANSRYIALKNWDDPELPSSFGLLWNLQTLVVYSGCDVTASVEFWKMCRLRHVEFTYRGRLVIPGPPSGHNEIMKDLHTLSGVNDFYLDKNVVRRIPNVKKLDVKYVEKQRRRASCLSYLQHLSKLETFRCYAGEETSEYLQKLSFPHSLKKLEIGVSKHFVLEDMLQKVASLPLLQKLVLSGGFFKRHEWETVEGQFPSLKLLELSDCCDLGNWTVERSHFPLLQKLHLRGLHELEEIPSEIGEISTLKSIVLRDCSRSLVLSVKEMVEEQMDLYGDQLDLHVTVRCENNEAEELQYLASPNFHVSL